jgi:large subunit ribosomal protein L4
LAAPQYKGGGIVFGPKPKFDQHTRINKKERRAAIRHLLAEKIKADQVIVLDKVQLDKPQTKTLANFFKALNLTNQRVLVLGDGELNQELYLSARNLPKKECSQVPAINGYNLTLCQNIIVLDSALEQLLSMLG